MIEDYFVVERRRNLFAKAVAAYQAEPNDFGLAITSNGHEISVAAVCDLMTLDVGRLPNELAGILSLLQPVSYAKAATHLKRSIGLPTEGDWVRR